MIQFEILKGVGKITLNRPDKYHSFVREMALKLQETLDKCNDNNEVRRNLRPRQDSGLDVRGAGPLTDLHIENFLETIRGQATQTAPIDQGHTSVLLCHLGNIAQRTGRALDCDPSNGRIKNDAEAMKLWSRDYEPGWELKV